MRAELSFIDIKRHFVVEFDDIDLCHRGLIMSRTHLVLASSKLVLQKFCLLKPRLIGSDELHDSFISKCVRLIQ